MALCSDVLSPLGRCPVKTRGAQAITCSTTGTPAALCKSAERAVFPPKRLTVYAALAALQAQEIDWPLRKTEAWLHLWTGQSNERLRPWVPDLSFCLAWLPARRFGRLRPSANGYGAKRETALTGSTVIVTNGGQRAACRRGPSRLRQSLARQASDENRHRMPAIVYVASTPNWIHRKEPAK